MRKYIREGKVERPRTEGVEKESENNLENNVRTAKEEYLFPLCVKKGTRAERVVVVCPGTGFLDPERQRPHLAFLLMNEILWK